MTPFARSGACCLLLLLLLPAGWSDARKSNRRPAKRKSAVLPVPDGRPVLSDEREIGRLKEQIETRMREIKPPINALTDFSKKYPGTEDLDTLRAQRLELRNAVHTREEDLKASLEEFKALRKEFQYKRGVMIIAQFMTGEEPKKVDSDLKLVLDLGDYPDQVKRVINQATKALTNDNVRFQEVVDKQRAVRRQRQMYILVGAGTGVLAAILFFAYRSRKRRRGTLTGIPVATLPQMGGPPTPAVRSIAGGMRTPAPALLGGHTPDPERLVPEMIGGTYKVIKEVSKGALGPVYEATDTGSGRKVIIKRIREELHRTEKDLERFLARARFVSSLKHPNLAEVYSVLLEEERIHLVIEDPEGLPLSKFLDSGNRIALPSVKRVMKQVCGLLDFAHAKKILHGDLMPSNIYVNNKGSAKVMDFGIGLEARKTAAKLQWSESIGSPAYMAPEQELGSIFPASDTYSLAVILYEMVTGNLPFEGPNFLAQKREKRFHPPSQRGQDIPKGLDAVMQKALEPEPQLRFAKAMDFYSMLETLPNPVPSSQSAPKTGHGA